MKTFVSVTLPAITIFTNLRFSIGMELFRSTSCQEKATSFFLMNRSPSQFLVDDSFTLLSPVYIAGSNNDSALRDVPQGISK
jgi:hypothetical protein